MKDYALKWIAAAALIFAGNTVIAACPLCRAQVQAAIYNENFAPNIALITLPVLAVALVGIIIFHADKVLEKLKVEKLNGKK